jgi:hypothetical protein
MALHSDSRGFASFAMTSKGMIMGLKHKPVEKPE